MKSNLSDLAKLFVDCAMSKEGQKFFCGTYSNGKPRSMVDALRDEFISPKDRERWEKKKKKKKKQTKKKNKKKNKKKSYYDYREF